MDQLLEALGAEVLDWDFKTECCGAGLAVSKTETVRGLCRRIVAEATHQKADAIVVACQLCQANLDMRQDNGAMPVLYFTQLMGLAFGMSAKELGLKHHLASPMKMLKAKGIGS
jgi:heterodisulfide reductase subunit B